MRCHSLVVIAVALLCACGLGGCTRLSRPAAPILVRVPVEKPMDLPAALTQDCPIARPADRSVQQVVAAYNANIVSLEHCNRQLQALRALQAETIER
ncbi:hypothetical protein WG628_18745 [Stenotrophomonas maltophilia]